MLQLCFKIAGKIDFIVVSISKLPIRKHVENNHPHFHDLISCGYLIERNLEFKTSNFSNPFLDIPQSRQRDYNNLVLVNQAESFQSIFPVIQAIARNDEVH